jgi:hypothetical protein
MKTKEILPPRVGSWPTTVRTAYFAVFDDYPQSFSLRRNTLVTQCAVKPWGHKKQDLELFVP